MPGLHKHEQLWRESLSPFKVQWLIQTPTEESGNLSLLLPGLAWSAETGLLPRGLGSLACCSSCGVQKIPQMKHKGAHKHSCKIKCCSAIKYLVLIVHAVLSFPLVWTIYLQPQHQVNDFCLEVRHIYIVPTCSWQMFSTLAIAQQNPLRCDSEFSCPLGSERKQAGPSSPFISHLCKY